MSLALERKDGESIVFFDKVSMSEVRVTVDRGRRANRVTLHVNGPMTVIVDREETIGIYEKRPPVSESSLDLAHAPALIDAVIDDDTWSAMVQMRKDLLAQRRKGG